MIGMDAAEGVQDLGNQFVRDAQEEETRLVPDTKLKFKLLNEFYIIHYLI